MITFTEKDPVKNWTLLTLLEEKYMGKKYKDNNISSLHSQAVNYFGILIPPLILLLI